MLTRKEVEEFPLSTGNYHSDLFNLKQTTLLLYDELDLVKWYFECDILWDWHGTRTDVDCIGSENHKKRRCPFCDAYSEINRNCIAAEADLQKIIGGKDE